MNNSEREIRIIRAEDLRQAGASVTVTEIAPLRFSCEANHTSMKVEHGTIYVKHKHDGHPCEAQVPLMSFLVRVFKQMDLIELERVAAIITRAIERKRAKIAKRAA
jgi:hypothetical protein